VVSAAASGFERAWPMPLYPEYRENMDSEIADIKNSGPRHAGALNAAAFLADFVTLDNWAHLDIAGPAWIDEKLPYAAKGGTGFGVSTVVSLVLRLASNVKSSP
jgi:leucyl aminopeptidase